MFKLDLEKAEEPEMKLLTPIRSRKKQELSVFFCDPVDVGNLISGSSAFSESSVGIWKFMVHILLKLGLENFDHYFVSM